MYPARLAQRESASLTRKRSLVQSQYRAPQSTNSSGPDCTGPLLSGPQCGRRRALSALKQPTAQRFRTQLLPCCQVMCSHVAGNDDNWLRSHTSPRGLVMTAAVVVTAVIVVLTILHSPGGDTAYVPVSTEPSTPTAAPLAADPPPSEAPPTIAEPPTIPPAPSPTEEPTTTAAPATTAAPTTTDAPASTAAPAAAAPATSAAPTTTGAPTTSGTPPPSAAPTTHAPPQTNVTRTRPPVYMSPPAPAPRSTG
jgi:hypothetical protein